MDLKQLLNQTNIKEKDSTTQQQDTDIDKPETNDLDNQDNDNQTPLIISSSEEEPEVTLDSRFSQPWNKLEKGSNTILKKIGEETAEFIMACKDDDKISISSEAADIIYHLQVALLYKGVNWREVLSVLDSRKKS